MCETAVAVEGLEPTIAGYGPAVLAAGRYSPVDSAFDEMPRIAKLMRSSTSTCFDTNSATEQRYIHRRNYIKNIGVRNPDNEKIKLVYPVF